MTPRMQALTMAIGASIFLFILDLVRRRRLSEIDSLFWLCASLVILVLPVLVHSLEALWTAIGIFDPNAGLFFFALVFVLLQILVLLVRVTRVGRGQVVLAQRLALLESRLAQVESPRDEPPIPDRGSTAS